MVCRYVEYTDGYIGGLVDLNNGAVFRKHNGGFTVAAPPKEMANRMEMVHLYGRDILSVVPPPSNCRNEGL